MEAGVPDIQGAQAPDNNKKYNNGECPVCFQLLIGERPVYSRAKDSLEGCPHQFHIGCILGWVERHPLGIVTQLPDGRVIRQYRRPTCPQCRQTLQRLYPVGRNGIVYDVTTHMVNGNRVGRLEPIEIHEDTDNEYEDSEARAFVEAAARILERERQGDRNEEDDEDSEESADKSTDESDQEREEHAEGDGSGDNMRQEVQVIDLSTDEGPDMHEEPASVDVGVNLDVGNDGEEALGRNLEPDVVVQDEENEGDPGPGVIGLYIGRRRPQPGFAFRAQPPDKGGATLTMRMIKRKNECEYCGSVFNNRGTLHKHIEILHLHKMYACELCGEKVCSTSNLNRHMRNKHN